MSDSAVARPSHAGRTLAVCVVVILVCSLLASLVQNSAGQVRVMGLKFPMQNGQWLTADLFRPVTATAETPAPLIFVVPGFQRSKEALNNLSIELSRRGYVVIAIDPYAQGNSSSSMSPRAATEEGYGLFALVDLVTETDMLNYVDQTKIAVTGHSAGGNAAILAAARFGREARRSGQPSKLHSVFISGFVRSFTERVLRDVRSNVGVSYARYDEGAYQNAIPIGDVPNMPETLRVLQMSSAEHREATTIELGRYYGQVDDRSLRVFFCEPTLHPIQPYLPEDTANQIAFFERTLGQPTPLPKDNQVWYWKEFLTLGSLLAAFYSVVPLAALLLAGVPWFRPLVKPVPPPQPQPQGLGKVLFYGLLLLGAAIACLTFIPMAELSKLLFADAAERQQTWFFPQRMNNAVMLWAVLNGLVGFALFFGAWWFYGRRHGAKPENWGIGTTWRELGATAVLGLLLFAWFYGLLAAVYYFFQVDFRFTYFGARAFQPVTLVFLLIYAPFFFIFFLSNSLRANASLRVAGLPPWGSLLLAGVANSLGLAFIAYVQYVFLAIEGKVFWQDNWLYVNLLFALVPIMFIMPLFHRWFFELTGRIYLGPMAMCPIFIMILVSNTVCYTPL